MASAAPFLTSYDEARGRLRTYFDSTARDAWEALTSDAPVSRIRATVRAGRDAMRATLLDWLPQDMRCLRVLDAGCGTGALAVEAARRGAQVVAIDVAGSLIDTARSRAPRDLGSGSIEWRVGDLLAPELGSFDHVVAMDSLIHYRAGDIARSLAGLAARTDRSLLFTFAPRTAPLALMHAVGRLFPRGDRAPSIEPVAEEALRRKMAEEPGLAAWRMTPTVRVASGFYTSQAAELVPA